ncbi:hypothetical protein D6D06_00238 [Aureobasidium pullulans]|nr:hypothetical protein D6D06_00238 [Aureobasidium pullulans]
MQDIVTWMLRRYFAVNSGACISPIQFFPPSDNTNNVGSRPSEHRRKMTGPNRTVIKRRLGHVFALFRRKGFLMEVDKAEGPSAWRQCRGIHPAAHKHLPEYGSDFQIHIQTPFKKLNIYTATLSIPGDPEPLFLTKSCPTPTEALETLRVMIMVSEDPLTKEKLANLQWEAMVAHHNNQMMRYSPKGLSEQDSDWS